MIGGNGNDFQRVQNHCDVQNFEGRIEIAMNRFPRCGFPYQRDHHPAPIVVEQRRLHDDDKGNLVTMFPSISMNIKLRHDRSYSVE